MHFEILVEEYSAEITLKNLLSKLIRGDHTFRIITSQGKSDLLKNLPAKLKGYSKWINPNMKIIVLLDRDSDDCVELKTKIDQMAQEAGLISKSTVKSGNDFDVMIRLAIEEIEAWFIGDYQAVLAAYPRVNRNFSKKAKFRDPDRIAGGTWEALEALLKSAGYFKQGYRKIEAANSISNYMEPLNNRSKSFQVFWNGIAELTEKKV